MLMLSKYIRGNYMDEMKRIKSILEWEFSLKEYDYDKKCWIIENHEIECLSRILTYSVGDKALIHEVIYDLAIGD